MSVQAATQTVAANPSLADLWRSVEALVPRAEKEAEEAERLTHLTDGLVAEFRRAGLYRLTLPREIGGFQLPWTESMRLCERMSWADGSAGWCMMVEGVILASMGAFLSEAAARTIWKTHDVTAAGNGVPRGLAKPVKDGFIITGHWSYGSTIYHAEWIHSGCFISDDLKKPRLTDGHPEIVLCHHPKSSIELKGNWDVLGLKGTGSYDYVIKEGEMFIPTEMTYPFDGPNVQRGGIQYGAGLPVLTTWGHTCWALGVGRRALDELAKHARGRIDPFGKLHESASFRKSFADAEAKYRSARAYVYDSWERLDETYARSEKASLEQIADLRLSMRHLHDVISDVSTFAHRVSRGHSLHPSVLQRCYRDIHAGTQHILLDDAIMQECGKVLLGTPSKDAEWAMFGVIEPGDAAGH